MASRRCCARAASTPHVVFRSDESGAVQRMVAAGIGSALLPRLAIDASIGGVVALDASRRVPARAIGLAWHRDARLSETMQDFIAAVRERCDELAQTLLAVRSPDRAGLLQRCHSKERAEGAVMRVGMLTGGGDCPGLNAVIRAATRRLVDGGAEPVGVMRGWRGMIDGLFRPLDLEAVSGILPRGGTILRTSRTNPFSVEGGVEAVRKSFEQLDGLIAIGGEDTLGVAARLHMEHGLPVVGVPKTIDNDLAATDQTFGFDTAVSIATDAIDRLHTTAESHDRVMVVEVMGRHAGWLAVASGIAGGADVVLIPEFPLTVERCADLIRRRHTRDKDFSIVVVSEGWPLTRDAGVDELSTPTGERDAFGHLRLGGVGQRLAELLEQHHRLRDARDDARPPPARRHADRLRPHPRHALRPARRRARAERAVRPDDGAARHGRHSGAARRGRQGAAHGAALVLRARRGVLRLSWSCGRRSRPARA